MEDTTKVAVYSNQPEVELFANGVSLGKKAAPEHFFYFEVPNAGETVLEAVAGELRDNSRIRKVELFNEAYRLKEKGAVLNWFDITAPEGYFSLNDKMSDIMASPEGKRVIDSMMKNLGESKPAGMEMNEGMMKMMGGFTVLRLTNLMGTAGVKMTKEELLDLNAELNKIQKP